jgi:tetratricopeptide (TPR) repeat protein
LIAVVLAPLHEEGKAATSSVKMEFIATLRRASGMIPFYEMGSSMAERDSIDIPPERIGGHQSEERSNIFAIIAGIMAFAAAAGHAGYYFYSNVEMFNPYRKTYERLGIDLPRSFERFGQASQYLDQVKREPCDNVAFIALAKLMEGAGYPRESAMSLEAYNRSCTFSEEMLQSAYAAYTRIGDHKAAINVADELVKFDSASYDYRFMRGSAYERSREYKAALADYISTLDLFPDLSKVAGSQFYQVSAMYDKIGKPCDAIGPLETYISYDVKGRQSQQIAKLISDYARKGKCAANYANGSARVLIPPSNLVDVVINGSRARMVLDTGASHLSLTPEMAARARIMPDASDLVEVKVVGGLLKQATGYAQTVQVAEATAANVPLLIAVGSKDAFGPGIDGLLGMTFLSRYTVGLSPGLLELKPRNRNFGPQ